MGSPIHPKSIVILDFGGQYAHLIGNRVRRLGAFSEIREAETPVSELKGAAGIILSGGPASVYEQGSPQGDPAILKLGIPILGICYGHQWIAHVLGGEVKPGGTKEYGRTVVRKSQIPNPKSQTLLCDLPDEFTVWMSHGDAVAKLPPGFVRTASSADCDIAAMEDPKRKIFGTQFHLEVTHTPRGMEILERFVKLCAPAKWSVEDFAAHIGDQVKKELGEQPHSAKASRGKNVFMLVSGGVDSTVAFTLLEKALGKDRVYGLLVDTGLMRKDEVGQITAALSRLNLDNLHVEDASDLFFERLKNVYDPEEKRKAIGQAFLEVQRDVAKRLKLDGPEWILGQGTIYPDTIETKGTKHADRIKTHHNRVEEIQRMMREGRVIEPLKDLYKDEVRKLGELLGLPHELVWRHPFPGPGLAVRILCAKEEVWPEGWQERHKEILSGVLQTIGKLPCPYAIRVLPLRSVGVQGDARTYRHAVALFLSIPVYQYTNMHWNRLWSLATKTPNTCRDFNRVLLCTSHTSDVFFERNGAHPPLGRGRVGVGVSQGRTPLSDSPPAIRLRSSPLRQGSEGQAGASDGQAGGEGTSPFVLTPSYITRERADLLCEADDIVDKEMRKAKLYESIWQFPVVLLPIGLKPGGQSIVLRPVDSTEAMTANATRLSPSFLEAVTEKLLKLEGVDLVFYDLTSKPPATIEWE